MLLLGDLPLRGAARLRKGDAASGGAPAALGCWIRERDMLFLGDLPLRGAAGIEKGRCCFWGISRCAGLLDYRKEVAVSRGSPAARGCSIREKEMLLLEELPLRGAAGLEKGICCF